MQKVIKGILINPTLRSVNLVEVGDYKSMQKYIGGLISGVGYIKTDGTVGDYEDDFIYADDEGLMKEGDFVMFKNGYGQKFYKGNLLIVGSDGEGDSTDVKLTTEKVRELVEYIPEREIRKYI